MSSHAAGDGPTAGRIPRKENPGFQPSRPRCPPRDILDRVVAALAFIGRPATASEVREYGRRMSKVRAAEIAAMLDQLVDDQVVDAVDRFEPRKPGDRVMITRRYYSVASGQAGD
jgi:hypothetical protein